MQYLFSIHIDLAVMFLGKEKASILYSVQQREFTVSEGMNPDEYIRITLVHYWLTMSPTVVTIMLRLIFSLFHVGPPIFSHRLSICLLSLSLSLSFFCYLHFSLSVSFLCPP